MKKFVTYAVMLAYLTVTISPIQAQYRYQPTSPQQFQSGGLPKVVVYVSTHRSYSTDEESALRTATLNTLVRSGRYDVIERSNVMDAELMKQTGGAVDDDQLTAFGRQAGSRYICIADMTFIRDRREPIYSSRNGNTYVSGYNRYRDHQVSVRMIDVETAEILAFGLVEQSVTTGTEMTNAVVSAVDKMLRTVKPAKADDLPKMAVYVTGARAKQREGNALYSYVSEALFTRSRSLGTFKVIERSEAFTRQIDREQETQRSGRVDDNQIAQLGKQYGIEYILVAGMDYAANNYIISSRIIDIETANVEKTSSISTTSSNLDDLGKISVGMVEEMMGITREETNQKLAEATMAAEAERKEQVKIWALVSLSLAVLLGAVIWAISNPKEDTTAGKSGRGIQ